MAEHFKTGDTAFVSFNADMLDFVADGTTYPAIRLATGWKVTHPTTRVTIAVPDSIIGYATSTEWKSKHPPAPTTMPPPSAGIVGIDLSQQEKTALDFFKQGVADGKASLNKAAQQGTGSELNQAFPARTGAEPEPTPEPKKKGKKKSIVEQMLDDEQALPEEVPLTAEEQRAAQEKEMEERWLAEVRKRLIPPPVQLLQEGQFWLTDMTEGQLPTSGVDHIITAYPEDHFPGPIRADIPEFNLYHAWNPDVLESIHMAKTLNVKNLLTGFPGSGKSTSVEQYAALIRQPFMKINGKSGIDGSAFIGFLWANAGGTQFAEGLLPVAMRNGYLLAIDEVFKIPAEVQMNFQTVYEENGFLLLDEKPGLLVDKLVHPHPDFRLMATDNCLGTGDQFEKFGATQVQDSSTLDRFGLTVLVPYLPLKVEVQVIRRMYPNVKEEAITGLVKVAGMVREAYQKSNISLTLSMRGLKVMARLMSQGISELHAFNMTYSSKLADDAEINTVQGFITTVGLSDKPGEAIIKEEPKPVWEEPVLEKPKKEVKIGMVGEHAGSWKAVKEAADAASGVNSPFVAPWEDPAKFVPPVPDDTVPF